MPAEQRTSGPTQMNPAHRWEPRPGFARALRLSAALLPIVLSVMFAFLLIRLLPSPATPGQTAGWWATLALTVVIFAVGCERVFRRLIPAATLLELSLAFPDAAPSRFNAALRTRSVRTLQRELSEGNLDPASAPGEAVVQLIDMSTALTNHDRATRGHTERVRAYAILIGEEMGLPEPEIERLRWAAMIHDVGKLKVPASILSKPSRPTDAEWAELSKHPGYGAEYVEPLRPWLHDWTDVAGQHHEHWDGSGYPVGLSGTDISLGARIVAVADAFDVMTSIRSYKDGSPVAEAKAELARCAGSQFDPEVVKAMLGVSMPRRRGWGLAAWFAQIPILGKSWPNSGVVAASVVAAVVAGGSLAPGEFSPELIAYGNLEAAEDSELRVEVAPAPLPDTVEIIEITGPATAFWNGKEIIIAGDPNASGDVTVVYEACWDDDCQVGSATATFVPVNDGPQAIVDRVTATSPGPITIRPLVNDTDLDSDRLALTSAEVLRGRAVVAVKGDELIVTPDDGDPQTINVSYTVTDAAGATDTGAAQVIVPDFNAAPTAGPDEATLTSGETVLIDVLANDSDPADDPLTIVSANVTDASLGTVEIEDNQLRFTAGPVSGVAKATYSISDGGKIAVGTILVTITPPPPTANADSASTSEDTTVSAQVLANDIAVGSPLDSASLSIVSVSLGRASVAGGGVITFVPEPDAYGIGSVVYEVCNQAGGCTTGSLVVQIARVNDAPFFTPGSNVAAALGSVTQLQWATDVSVGEDNEPTQTVTFEVSVDNAAVFAVAPTISPAGELRFESSDVAGTATVTARANDGIDVSQPATFTITVG
ncbi:MAG: HD domain-containing protein [Acidimicrobiales bacterium]|nr:HD domain-containing protein [Acidimicrobiales bacterium]